MIDHTGKTLCEIVPKMQHGINSLCNWFAANKLTISVSKSCSMVIGSPQNVNQFSHYESLGLFINGVPLRYCSSYKYLGLKIDSTLSWNNATSNVCKKLRSRLAVLQRLCNVLPVANINNLYYSFIQCHIDYCLTVWGHTSQGNTETIQRFQNRAGRILSRNFVYLNFSGISIVKELGWLTVSERKDYLTLITIYKCINNLAPHYLIDMFNYVSDIHGRLTRLTSHLQEIFIFNLLVLFTNKDHYNITVLSYGIPYLIVCEMLILLKLLKLYVNHGCFLNDVSISNYCVFRNLCVCPFHLISSLILGFFSLLFIILVHILCTFCCFLIFLSVTFVFVCMFYILCLY